MKGSEKRAERGESIKEIASVASISVSRVDTKIAELLDAKIGETDDEPKKQKLHFRRSVKS